MIDQQILKWLFDERKNWIISNCLHVYS